MDRVKRGKRESRARERHAAAGSNVKSWPVAEMDEFGQDERKEEGSSVDSFSKIGRAQQFARRYESRERIAVAKERPK